MNKKKIVIYILILFSVILIINGVKTNADTATGEFQLANLPPEDPVTFRVKDYHPEVLEDCSAGGVDENFCFDFYDLNGQDLPLSNDDGDGDSYADTHMIYSSTPALEMRWEIGEDPNYDPVYPLICISSTSTNRDAAKAAYDPTTELATDAEYCDVLNLWTDSLVTPLSINSVASYIFDGSEDQFNHSVDELAPDKEYYITMINYDGAASSSFYDVEVWVKNQAPTQITGFVTEDISAVTHPAEFNNWFPGGTNPWVPGGNQQADTHLQEPNLNWDDATDPDDGTGKDIYPGDPVVYYLYVGDDAGSFGTFDATRIKYDAVFLPVSRFTQAWDQYLEWGTTPVAGETRSTYYYTINSTDGWLEAITTGNFDLVDNLPTIWSIGMWNDGMDQGTEECPSDDVPTSQCTLLGTEHDYTQNILLNITFEDADKDFRVDAIEYGSDPNTCPGGICFDGILYLCLDTNPICDELNYDYGPFSLQQLNPNPQYPEYSYLTRIGVTEDEIDIDGDVGTPTPEFYKPYGTYLVHAIVTSHSTVQDDTDPDVDSTWEWESFRAPHYEEDVSGFVYIGDGSIELWDTWNPGTDRGLSGDGSYDMINWGNTILNLEWGSGDYFHTLNDEQAELCSATAGGIYPELCSGIPGALCGWDVDNVASGILIDDDDDCDSSYPDGGYTGCGEAVETGLSQVKIEGTPTYNQFVYATGLTLCNDFNCDTGDERLPTHWHVSPIAGLCADAPGTYQGLIEWVDSEWV